MMLAYNCAKAGVDALTRTLAKEGKRSEFMSMPSAPA